MAADRTDHTRGARRSLRPQEDGPAARDRRAETERGEGDRSPMKRERTESAVTVDPPTVEVVSEPRFRLTLTDELGRARVRVLTRAQALTLAWQLLEATTLQEDPRG